MFHLRWPNRLVTVYLLLVIERQWRALIGNLAQLRLANLVEVVFLTQLVQNSDVGVLRSRISVSVLLLIDSFHVADLLEHVI